MNIFYHRFPFVLTAFWLGLLIPTALWADPYKFSADADFLSIDESGCVTTEVFLFVRTAHVGAKNSSSKASIRVFRRDDCQETERIAISNFVTLKPNQVEYNTQLNAARITAQVRLPDLISQRKLTLDIDVTWEGYLEPILSTNRRVFDQPGKVISRARPFYVLSRRAKAFGSIQLGKDNLTPNPSIDAAIALDSPRKPTELLTALSPHPQ